MKRKSVKPFSRKNVVLICALLLGSAGTYAFSTQVFSFGTSIASAAESLVLDQAERSSGPIHRLASEERTEDDPKAALGANDKFVYGLGNLPLSFATRRDKIFSLAPGGSPQELANVNDFEPSWSPDGKKIVFVSLRDGATNSDANRRLYKMNADGSDQERLASGPFVGGEAQPSFSYHTNQNEQRIVYVADYSPSGHPIGIYTMNSSGSGTPVRLDTDACFEEDPDDINKRKSRARSELTPGIYGFDTPNYSPNNNFIIFGYPNNSDSVDVYRIGADGSNCTLLYEGEDSYYATTARYSRDGTKIALYHRDGDGFDHKLRIINSTTGALLQEFQPTNFFGSPVWSPNPGENKIAYLAGDQNPDNPIEGLEIRTIDLGTSLEEQIVSQGVPYGLRGMDWGIPSAIVPPLTLRINQPHPLLGGTSTTGTLTRATPAPAGGVTITLLAGNPVGQTIISLPSTSVFIPEGQTQGTFQIDAPNRSDFRAVDIFANSPNPNFGQAKATVSVTPSRPDLRAVSITGPASVAPGVSFSLNTSVDNVGQATTGTGWTDRVYFSIDDQFDAGDTLIRTTNNATALAAGATRNLTNLSTTILASVAPTSGQYYLFLRTNQPEAVNEGGRTTTNTAMTTIQIELPDLVAENLVLPPLVQAGVTYPVSWTTRNAGTATSGTFGSRLYYSSDATLGDVNDLLLDTVTNNALAPNATQNHNTSFNIPTVPARADGTAYFYVKVDYANAVYEGLPAGTGENNNTTSANRPFEYRVADLQVPSTSAPVEVETETTFAMEWTTTNTGNRDATPFDDRVFFSLDNQVGSDIALGTFQLSGGLAQGASVNRIQNVTIPTSAIAATGNYFVYVRTDGDTDIDEGVNENNNIRFQPVTVRRLLRPDLVVSNITAPPTAFFDQTIQIQWTVTNNGQGPTNASNWKDRININTTGSNSSSTKLIDVESISALNPGESYVASATVKIPRGLNGSYMVVVTTDITSKLNEESTTNNRLTRPITLNVPPLPDLTVSNVQAPDQSFAGGPLNVSWQVNNIGDAAAVDNNEEHNNPWQWKDRVYLSRDQVLNTSQDRLIFTSGTRASPLAPGASFSRNTFVNALPTGDYVKLPTDVSGEYYVFAITDTSNSVYEFNSENNNHNFDQTQPGSPINILVTPADLVVLNEPTATSAASGGQFIDVSFTVRNQGAFATGASWTNGLYLSADQTYDAGDTLLGSRGLSSLPPGAESLVEMSIQLPNCISGSQYLIARADTENKVAEFDPGYDAEANNVSPTHAIVMTSPPIDLQATNVQHSPVTVPGQVINVMWTETNNGTGPSPSQWVDRILLKSIEGLDSVEIGRVTQSGSLAAGQAVARNANVGLPAFMQGQYVISIQTDYNRVVTECGVGEDNNTTDSDPFSATNNLPDLIVDAITAPATPVTAGQNFLVEWTGRNAGSTNIGEAPGWFDTVYLSSDPNLSNGDRNLGSFAIANGLNSGQTYQGQLNANTGNVSGGQYYILIVTDNGTDIYEGPSSSTYETNNVKSSSPFTVGSPNVDLQATVNTVGTPTYAGTSIPVTWTVTNSGTTPTLGNAWTDYIILSRDAVLDSTDKTLGYLAREEVLAAGANYQQTKFVTIPSGLTGLYRIFVVTDKSNKIAENNDTNNLSPAFDVNLELTPPADLNITNIVVPGAQTPGESSNFQWSVQNTGSFPAIGPWRDSVYLSKDQFWDPSDYLIGQRERIGPSLGISQTEDESLAIRIPMIEEDNYYVIVRVDSQNRVRENNEANNLASSVLQMPITVQTLTLNTPFMTTLNNGAQKSFKFDTPANETVVVSLFGQPGNSNELFTKFLKAASRADYDYQSSGNPVPNQENFISNTEEGKYYSFISHDYIQPEESAKLKKESVPAENAKTGVTPVPPQNITVSANVLPFSIHSVSPPSAGHAGIATITVKGAKFGNDVAVKLVATNKSEITPQIVRNNATTINALFDLKGRAAGVYDVVVTNPGGQSTRSDNSFTILSGGGHSVRASINGPTSLRPLTGRARYTFTAANDGINDAQAVPLIISLPAGMNYTIDAENFMPFPSELMPAGVNQNDIPLHYDIDGRRYIYLIVPLLRARTSLTLGIDLRFTSWGGFAIGAAVGPPLTDLRLDQAGSGQLTSVATLNAGTSRSLAPSTTNDDVAHCLEEFFRGLAFALFDLIPGLNCATSISSVMANNLSGIALNGYNRTLSFDKTGIGMGLTTYLIGMGEALMKCAGKQFPLVKLISLTWTLGNLAKQLLDCIGQLYLSVTFPQSLDPNEKVAPKGYGVENFVGINQSLEYRINFENVSTAEAPAQRVFISDELPPTLDPRTVRLKEIGFKQNNVVIPENQAFYQARIQLGEDLNNLYADISGGLDIANRRITWTITAIDPQTGERPLDPLVGLLPPNNETFDGQGYVTFTVQPVSTFPNRTAISNQATIVFDENEAIVTNATANLLDSVVPTSAISTLPAITSDPAIAINWSGTDDADGSGFKACEIRISENDGGFLTALSSDTLTGGAIFDGKWGKKYKMFSVCSDYAGNVELPPTLPDAETTVLGGDTEGDVAPRPNGNDGQVNDSDLTQVRRFVAGLDSDYQYNEFQRVDMAPRDGGGNGGLTASDIVQARRYAAGLDTRAEAAGPNQAAPFAPKTVAGKSSAAGLPRELKPVRLGRIANKLYVAVDLEAQGDEVAVGFTLNFSTSDLLNPANIQLGTGAGTAVLMVNDSQAAQGRLGFTLDKAPNDPMPAGKRQLITLEFTIPANPPPTTIMSFGNGPVFDEIANGLATPVQTTFSSGTISLIGPTAAGVTISGRVMNGTRGISKANVLLTDPNGTTLQTRTNNFGYFRFNEVPAGQTYVVSISAKRYTFSSRVLSVTDDISDLVFTPDEIALKP